MEKKAFNVKELAIALGVSLPTAYELVHQVDFPAIKIGRRIVVPADKLQEWINKQAEVSTV